MRTTNPLDASRDVRRKAVEAVRKAVLESNPTQVAALLNVSAMTISRWLGTGNPPAYATAKGVLNILSVRK